MCWCLLYQLIIIVIFTGASTKVHSEWVEFAKDLNKSEYFYDDLNVARMGPKVLVWVRTRYAKPSKFNDLSSEIYQQIDCAEFSLRYIQAIYYYDKDWSEKSASEGKQPKISLPENSVFEKLADILCD